MTSNPLFHDLPTSEPVEVRIPVIVISQSG